MSKELTDTTCRICMHEIKDPVAVKGCSHAFCYSCIQQWTASRNNPSCPVCRTAVTVLVLANGAEEEVKPGTAAQVEEADLSCLDHQYFLGEVSRLLSRANSVHNQLYSEAYGSGRKGGGRQLQQSLEHVQDVLGSLNSYRSSLQQEARFDPEVLLQDLYRLDRLVTSAQTGTPEGHGVHDSTGSPQGGPTAGAILHNTFSDPGDEDYSHDEDHYEDEEDSWHEGLSKTPGRRPTSRHVNSNAYVKNRPDRLVRVAGQQQRVQRR